MVSDFFSRLLLSLIQGYQSFISPVLPGRCRYYPTCSQYGKLAIQWHGAGKGGLLTIKRICRCHPLGGHGIDFVPLPLYKYCYTPVKSLSTALSSNIIQPDNEIVSRGTIIKEGGVYRDNSSYAARLNSLLL